MGDMGWGAVGGDGEAGSDIDGQDEENRRSSKKDMGVIGGNRGLFWVKSVIFDGDRG